MDMLRVVGQDSRAGAVVNADKWVPLMVTWEPRPPGLQLHLSMAGVNGGSVEFKVSRENGALVRVAVVNQPPAAARDIPLKISKDVAYASPIVDTSAWGSNLPIPEKANIDHVDGEAELGFARDGNRVLLTFDQGEAVRYIVCGDVAVGVAADGRVVEIVADVIDLKYDWSEIMAEPSR